jgi:hypothetical protein
MKTNRGRNGRNSHVYLRGRSTNQQSRFRQSHLLQKILAPQVTLGFIFHLVGKVIQLHIYKVRSMNILKKKVGVAVGTAGTAGAAISACAACCVSIPLIGPILVWAGITTAGGASTGWYLPAISLFAIGAGIWIFVAQRRRAKKANVKQAYCGGEDCSTSCKIG